MNPKITRSNQKFNHSAFQHENLYIERHFELFLKLYSKFYFTRMHLTLKIL